MVATECDPAVSAPCGTEIAITLPLVTVPSPIWVLSQSTDCWLFGTPFTIAAPAEKLAPLIWIGNAAFVQPAVALVLTVQNAGATLLTVGAGFTVKLAAADEKDWFTTLTATEPGVVGMAGRAVVSCPLLTKPVTSAAPANVTTAPVAGHVLLPGAAKFAPFTIMALPAAAPTVPNERTRL